MILNRRQFLSALPHLLDSLQIYVVDSLDRERIYKAKAEFQAIIKDPFMLNSIILVFANKQDMRAIHSLESTVCGRLLQISQTDRLACIGCRPSMLWTKAY